MEMERRKVDWSELVTVAEARAESPIERLLWVLGEVKVLRKSWGGGGPVEKRLAAAQDAIVDVLVQLQLEEEGE